MCIARMTSLFAGLILVSSMLAQQPGRSEGRPDREAMRERMEAMAVGFLTEELELSADQAQVFWPIFNEHKKNKKAVQLREREARAALGGFEGGTQAEFIALLDALEAAEIESAQVRVAFLTEVAEAFDPGFAVRCVHAQEAFEQRMRSRFQKEMSSEDRRALGKMGRGPGRQGPR
jgi:Spy/CpxP family protein refolding chaperone